MQDIFDKIQKRVEDYNIWHFEITNYENNGSLKIIGSMDAYYHDIEIDFFDVSYLDCRMEFSDAIIRLATEDDLKDFKFGEYAYNDDKYYIICIVANRYIQESIEKYFIVAKDIKTNFDTVYHYKKEDLKEGERIADWVK